MGKKCFLWFLDSNIDMTLRISYSAVFIKNYFKESSSFSFSSCLPSGWTFLLISGVITLISENIFLDQENFWPTFMIHLSVGLACFCISSYVMQRKEHGLPGSFLWHDMFTHANRRILTIESD
ncbi:hypothetical protein Ahy_B03g067394 isoform E [Arachis hypogaea]|uniref:Protein RFT1 homolog n=1 Tax=Arachis hypogaea TaxID=3818 RepID=A0A445A6N7_ARAHY|nr:hypothetical protein Ahy_B03g067394 isoform E [Arachis hypogaea]